jgi:hypothetical protein
MIDAVYEHNHPMTFITDVKPYIKVTNKYDWYITTNGDDESEFKDEFYYLTDGYRLYIIPSDKPSKFRAGYEADINKLRLKKDKTIKKPTIDMVRRIIPADLSVYEEVKAHRLRFRAEKGFVVELESENYTEIMDMNLLFDFGDIVKDFPEYGDFKFYITSRTLTDKQGKPLPSPVIVMSEGKMVGLVQPLKD